MNYLVDSDWLIDASIGNPTAVRLLDHLRDEGLAISIVSYGFEFQPGRNDAFKTGSAEAKDFRHGCCVAFDLRAPRSA